MLNQDAAENKQHTYKESFGGQMRNPRGRFEIERRTQNSISRRRPMFNLADDVDREQAPDFSYINVQEYSG
ncbi:hypothetical protein B0H12DRAFT_1126190 [Mycena haematopus]|nr:hypothetical protein B0H12DRAFT_1126190 [Mycena haematopus]